jgi:hypothetical protein
VMWKARDRGANLTELFSNSPMRSMCQNLNPSGSASGAPVVEVRAARGLSRDDRLVRAASDRRGGWLGGADRRGFERGWERSDAGLRGRGVAARTRGDVVGLPRQTGGRRRWQ